ncbi:hypothetical protein BKA63DRAFT_581476 [Paraphoma chrysanthemicola]|nr:hypothetical protein BKA63DRAFT_581476 [Paraphoma chrysanthemicola]
MQREPSVSLSLRHRRADCGHVLYNRTACAADTKRHGSGLWAGVQYATCGELGTCCSSAGKCGSTEAECAPGSCYSGDCLPGRGSDTQDGRCGPDNYDWICGDSAFGKCCGVYGWCGNSIDHCAPGNCHSGDCDQTLGGPSTDGSCGPNFPGDKICAGAKFGKCCSNYGYCGDSDIYCGKENCHSGECQT